jgi:inosose dehydratase
MSRPSLSLATAPVTWGVDLADAPSNPPWPHVLDEIARSGVGALELGPVGFLPEDPACLREALRSRGLTAVGSFVSEDLHDPAALGHVMQSTERTCRAIAAAEGSVLVIIDRPSGERAATAGRPAASVRADGAGWSAIVDAIERIAAMAASFGLRPAVHPHAGTYVEYDDEVERLLDDCDVGLCLDTGHLAYAGTVAHEALARYGDRLVHLHLKDVAGGVLERVRRERAGFGTAVDLGIFCALGRGVVDLGAVLDALEAAGYRGFATIEQDRAAGSDSPLRELAESVDALTAAADTAAAEPPVANAATIAGWDR